MASLKPALVFIGFMGAGKSRAAREASAELGVPAAAVVGEAMVAFVLAGAYRDKFGGDHIDDVREAVERYEERIGWRRARAY